MYQYCNNGSIIMVTHSYFHKCACNLNTYLAVYRYVQKQLTTSGHISRNESWEARSAGVATSSVVTFCIHTEISTQLAFIDICKDGIHQHARNILVQFCMPRSHD